MKAARTAICALVLCALLMTAAPFGYCAETRLTTVVPDKQYTVKLLIGSGGSVRVNGEKYTGTCSLQFDAGSVITYNIDSNSGYSINYVRYSGTDVTASIRNEAYTAPELNGDSVLEVGFSKNSCINRLINYIKSAIKKIFSTY